MRSLSKPITWSKNKVIPVSFGLSNSNLSGGFLPADGYILNPLQEILSLQTSVSIGGVFVNQLTIKPV
jgi:hypothetical protein